jgi:Protein of unknown function (DUF2939)
MGVLRGRWLRVVFNKALLMVKKIIAGLAVAALLFVAWPLWSGWHLRQAMRNRDVAALEQRVDWATLRLNLKPKIAAAIQENADQSGKVGGYLKRALGAMVADKGVDYLVTPQNLSRVLAGREFVTTRLKRDPSPATAPPEKQVPKGGTPDVSTHDADQEEPDDPMPPRRLRWAFFESPTRFRIEATHPRIPNGRIVAILAQQGFGWRLVDTDIIQGR